MKISTSACLLAGALASAQVEFQDPIVLVSPNAQADGAFGAEGVTSVPDVNGDGIDDIAIGALGEYSWSGRVYVFDGATREVLTELRTPSGRSGSEFGAKIAGLGDVNGNGSGEVIVATHGNENTVHVMDGATGERIHSSIFMRARSLSAVPDATGDGIPDILASAQGSAAVYNGATGAIHRSLSPPAGSTNMFGWACSAVPDVNDDGRGDVAVGDWRANTVHLFDGATGSLLSTVRDPGGASTGFGRSVAGIEDVTRDGRGDLLVGAGDSGKVHLCDGRRGRVARTMVDPVGDNGLGWVVSSLPDVTGDGRAEAVVSGYIRTGNHNAYVFDPLNVTHLATLPGHRDFGGGDSLAGIPDVNGDGRGEVLVGNWGAPGNGIPGAGRVLLYLSVPPEDTRPAVTFQDGQIHVAWKAGIYNRLQVSTDGQSWEDLVGVDAMLEGSHTESLGSRGSTALFRLGRD